MTCCDAGGGGRGSSGPGHTQVEAGVGSDEKAEGIWWERGQGID